MPSMNKTMGQIGSALEPMAGIFSAIGTGVSGYNQARASAAEGAYYKQIYDANANLMNIQAADAIERGEKAATEHKKATKRLIGAQRAAMAAQGIDIDDGSALDVQMDTAGLGAMDALEIKNNAWREAWGYKVQAANYTSQGVYADLTAKNKSRNTILTTGLGIAKDLSYSAYLKKTKTVPTYGTLTD